MTRDEYRARAYARSLTEAQLMRRLHTMPAYGSNTPLARALVIESHRRKDAERDD